MAVTNTVVILCIHRCHFALLYFLFIFHFINFSPHNAHDLLLKFIIAWFFFVIVINLILFQMLLLRNPYALLAKLNWLTDNIEIVRHVCDILSLKKHVHVIDVSLVCYFLLMFTDIIKILITVLVFYELYNFCGQFSLGARMNRLVIILAKICNIAFRLFPWLLLDDFGCKIGHTFIIRIRFLFMGQINALNLSQNIIREDCLTCSVADSIDYW